MVHNDKLEKNSGCGITRPIKMSSHNYGGVVNQKHDRLFGEAETCVLKPNYKMYVSYISLNIRLIVNSGLDAGGIMRNYHDTLMSSGEDSRETNLRNPDGGKDVVDIMSNMLT
ncbi:unnamed protein product [Vicia faba]|uniref:Uncharacterized protein n=1 Tax=Vicia faba TaxID=3906 RepID=A0AAV1ACA7_VICFA|nr:unnamed protein product [Vicia faba]